MRNLRGIVGEAFKLFYRRSPSDCFHARVFSAQYSEKLVKWRLECDIIFAGLNG